MSPKEVREAILAYLARGVPQAAKRFEADTGRFLAGNGGWAVTNQDIIYPLALLWATEGTDRCGDEQVLDLVCRGGDALRDWQDEKGAFEFIKPDGSRWGQTYMCWSMYHWVEAYGLVRDALDAARRARWEQGLRLSFDGVTDELRASGRLHNIPCWHAMGLVRASQLLGEPRWGEFGRELIGRHVAIQNDDGYWPESGPTTSYNNVYVHAVGLYYWFTGDESVLRCLERALQFHLHFTYPDGSAVETIDGRVRYHPGLVRLSWPGFLPFPAGRRFVKRLVGLMCREGEGKLSTNLAAVAQHLPDEPDAPLPLGEGDYVSIYRDRALVRRAGPWFYCLSGYVTPTEDIPTNTRSRWRLDRQNYVSVWHERGGVVVGGGNSKGQPDLSTFVVIAGRIVHHAADEAELSSGDDGDVLALRHGPATCELTAGRDGGGVSLTFRAVESSDDVASVVAAFSIPVIGGKSARTSNRDAAVVLDPLAEFGDSWAADSAERWLRIGDVRYDLPADCSLTWPVYPYNPYAADNAAAPAAAVAVVSMPLTVGGPGKTVRVSVVDE